MGTKKLREVVELEVEVDVEPSEPALLLVGRRAGGLEGVVESDCVCGAQVGMEGKEPNSLMERPCRLASGKWRPSLETERGVCEEPG